MGAVYHAYVYAVRTTITYTISKHIHLVYTKICYYDYSNLENFAEENPISKSQKFIFLETLGYLCESTKIVLSVRMFRIMILQQIEFIIIEIG